MATINGLCLLSLPGFIEHLIDFKMGWGKDSLSFTLNILRFPSFQSPVVMPEHVKVDCINNLEILVKRYENSPYLHQMEVEHIKRLINYLGAVNSPHEGASSMELLQKDFKSFYSQYDERRNKNFLDTFPSLREWYNGIQL